MSLDLAAIRADVEAVLREAGARFLMANFGKLDESQIRQKSSPGDLVTEIDEAAEDFFRERFQAILPAAQCVGEEAAAADPGIVGQIAGEGIFWVVDPIDGTRNFIRGKPEFGSIVALVENGRTLAGWVYAAPENRLYACIRGEAPMRDGAPIEVAPMTGARPRGLRSLGWMSDAWRARVEPGLRDHVETVPSHCSAYAYIRLLEGGADFKLSSRIHPWDHLAGAFLLEAAGGSTRFLDDGSVYGPADSVDRPLLAVAPGRDWAAIAALLR